MFYNTITVSLSDPILNFIIFFCGSLFWNLFLFKQVSVEYKKLQQKHRNINVRFGIQKNYLRGHFLCELFSKRVDSGSNSRTRFSQTRVNAIKKAVYSCTAGFCYTSQLRGTDRERKTTFS